MIRKTGPSTWTLFSHDGKKVLGRFPSLRKAKLHEMEVNYFKHKKKRMKKLTLKEKLTKSLAKEELKQRAIIKGQLLKFLEEGYELNVKGCTKRGELQLYLYQKLGGVGYPSRPFIMFVNKFLTEIGFRGARADGRNYYRNIKPKSKQDSSL